MGRHALSICHPYAICYRHAINILHPPTSTANMPRPPPSAIDALPTCWAAACMLRPPSNTTNELRPTRHMCIYYQCAINMRWAPSHLLSRCDHYVINLLSILYPCTKNILSTNWPHNTNNYCAMTPAIWYRYAMNMLLFRQYAINMLSACHRYAINALLMRLELAN